MKNFHYRTAKAIQGLRSKELSKMLLILSFSSIRIYEMRSVLFAYSLRGIKFYLNLQGLLGKFLIKFYENIHMLLGKAG